MTQYRLNSISFIGSSFDFLNKSNGAAHSKTLKNIRLNKGLEIFISTTVTFAARVEGEVKGCDHTTQVKINISELLRSLFYSQSTAETSLDANDNV